MIEKIIEWSVKNKFMVILATIFVILGGTMAMLNTPLDAIPDLSDVQMIVYHRNSLTYFEDFVFEDRSKMA